MKKVCLLVIMWGNILNCCAQKWAVRIGFNNLKSYCDINMTSINDPNKNVLVTNEFYIYPSFLRRSFQVAQLSNFWDVSIIRNIDKKQAVTFGSRVMYIYLFSTIKHYTNYNSDKMLIGTHTHGEAKSFPALKLNYIHTILQGEKINTSSASLFAGIVAVFKNIGGSFGSGGWGSAVGVLDTSGNMYYHYVSARTTGVRQPKYPVPYLNAGIEGSLRLGKRFKIGLELAGYVGPRSLYIQEITGETNDAKFTYEIKLQPYFISGGIFVQYRIE